MSINQVSKLAIIAVLASSPAAADAPRVSTDVAPIHSLVAAVMGDLGTPDLLIPQGASAHDGAMRPSEARALSASDLVVVVGAELTPQLEETIETLAPDAHVLELSEVEGVTLLPIREELHDHGDHDDNGHEDHDDHDHEEHADHDDHEHDDHEEHADHDDHDHEEHADHDDHEEHEEHEEHADHDDHDHEEHADHDDHGDHDEHGHDDHAHGSDDPHLWLDPANALTWLPAIAEELAELDPENAETYRANAAAAADTVAATMAELFVAFATLEPANVLVSHDAYQYFEARFDQPILGAVALYDESAPSAGRLDELRDIVADEGADCIMVEFGFNEDLIAAVSTEVVQTFDVDPLGFGLELGPELYPNLIARLGDALVNCR